MHDTAQDWTVLRMINWATDYFASRSVPSPRLSIEWLLADVLNTKRLNLYVQFERPLSSGELTQLRLYVKRRAEHEPLQYITGSTSFYNATIAVDPSVLIPRPETEQLTEIILREHPSGTLSVLDIGTGSGCIAIALKMERPEWQVTGLDISAEALKTAAANGVANQTDITWVQGDLLSAGTLPVTRYNLIVSNPPYILPDEADQLQPQVKNYEPHLALFCQNQRAMYEHLARYAHRALTDGGCVYAELHESYNPAADHLFAAFSSCDLLNDYEGKVRFLKAVK